MDRYEQLYNDIQGMTKTDAIRRLKKEISPATEIRECVAKHCNEYNVFFVEVRDPLEGIVAIERQNLNEGTILTFIKENS